MTDTEFIRDEDGNVLNPPVIPEHEAKIHAAASSGSDEAVQAAQADYDKAREELIREIESKSDDYKSEDDDDKSLGDDDDDDFSGLATRENRDQTGGVQ